MNKKYHKKRFISIIVTFLFLSTVFFVSVGGKNQNIIEIIGKEDYDPLVDIEVTVEIQKIRAYDKTDLQVWKREYIDSNSDPDFYVKIIIEDQEFTSDVWHDTKYIYDPQFSATLNVPDDDEYVNVKIQLWDWNSVGDVLCDIGDETDDAEMTYNIKTGHWLGDDQIGDKSGYGRLNGCDDQSCLTRDLDGELWFNIYQNDYDGDNIPYWTEVYEYGTDPEVDNTGEDSDEDDVPIEWEWKWEYDPFHKDNHNYIDPEVDGLNNYEEYLTSQWFSDPYRKDLFIELDQMEAGPNGEPASLLPEESKELLYTAHDRQNIVYHLDDGTWEGSDSDILPYDEESNENEMDYFYWEYFLHHDNQNWKRYVFHYGIVIHQGSWANGNAFGPNRFQISSRGLDIKAEQPLLERNTVYASAYMHENGHTLGFRGLPGHDEGSVYPWQIGWWINRPYKSCMNYGYMFYTVDYSDGSRRDPDLDDWERMDLTAFQRTW